MKVFFVKKSVGNLPHIQENNKTKKDETQKVNLLINFMFYPGFENFPELQTFCKLYKKELYESLLRLGVIIVLHVAISHQSFKKVKVYTLCVSY